MNTPDFLKSKVDLFKELPGERLQQLPDGSRTASFEANEVVAHCGESAVCLNVVLSGSIAASLSGDGGSRTVIGRLGPAEPLANWRS